MCSLERKPISCEIHARKSILRPTSFVSEDELDAIVSREAIPKAGRYTVKLKCEGEALPESHRAHLVVGFKP